MTSSSQQPGDGDNDPTVIRPASGPEVSFTKKTEAGDSDAATTAYQTPPDPYATPYSAGPDPYAAPNPYAPADPYAGRPNPYAAPADPYAANPYQANPYNAPADPYAANPYGAPADQSAANPQAQYGAPPAYPAQPGYPGGAAPGYPAYGQPQGGTNGLATASLVCGILAYPLSCIYIGGFFAAIAGLITGIIGMKQIKQTGQQGHGMALAGVILSAVYLVLAVIGVIALVIIAANGGFDNTRFLLGLLG